MPDCPECGFGYVAGIPSNTRAHKKFHDETVNGIPAEPLPSDRVTWEKQPYRVTVVNHSSPVSQKKRAEKAGIIANRDLRYDFKPYSAIAPWNQRDVHLFLLHHLDRIVGFLVVEKRSPIGKCTWEECERREWQKLSDHPPIWSVTLIWINKQHRHKGLAGRLTTEAARFLHTDVQQLGWYAAFKDLGKAFVKRMCPEWFFIAGLS